MKAVVYHADAHYVDGESVGDTYRKLFKGFKENCHKFGLQVIHVTLEGHEGWGDENYFVPGLDPKNVMLNREICFSRFLSEAPDDVYWFTETDYRIFRPWPALTTDCCFLLRPDDDVKINPAWRMATPKAAPIFDLICELTKSVEIRPGVGFDWHCDSEGFTKFWECIGKPWTLGRCDYKEFTIELRRYQDYIKPNCIYGRNYMFKGKQELLDAEGG